MDDAFLTRFAREANAVSIDPGHVAAMAGALRHINQRVADAAAQRLGVTHAVESFETFRASHAAVREADPE